MQHSPKIFRRYGTPFFLSLMVVVWMFLFPGNRLLLAQNNQIDSLHQVLEHTEDDSSRAEMLLEIGSVYDQIDPHKFIEYAEEAMDYF